MSTESGYTGGHVPEATYKQVCTGTTGHVEAVRVTYDPNRVSYNDLIKIFWENHNPSQANGQGVNIGSQYLAAVFFHSPEQEAVAIATRNALQESGRVQGPVTTQILAATDFVVAEDYHQQYYEKQGLVTPRKD